MADLRGRLARWLLGLDENDVRHLRYLLILRRRQSRHDYVLRQRLQRAAERMGAGDHGD